MPKQNQTIWHSITHTNSSLYIKEIIHTITNNLWEHRLPHISTHIDAILVSDCNCKFSIIKILHLHVVKSTKIKKTPCTNPHDYCKVVEPIYEVHKVSRQELTELPCRPTHMIKVRSSKILENDNL